MKKNFQKKIFVVDSPYSAMFVSCILDYENIDTCNLLIEIKKNLDLPTKHIFAIKSILSNHKINYLKTATVPAPYFITKKNNSFYQKLKDLLKFKKKLLRSYSPLKLTKYICSTSSGIVKLVKSKNATCFDHGLGDYLTPLIIKNNIINFFLNLVKIFFLKKIGLYNYFSYDSYYTPFFFKKNINKFIDLSKYRIPLFLRNKLTILKLNHKKIVLVLVRSEWHLSKKKPEHSSFFDTFNLKLILRNCSKNESIIIKYHPSVFLKKPPNESLERKCKDLGYNVISVDRYLPNNLKGMLPAEIIINHFNIKKIVSADGSAVLFNFSHLNNIEKIIDHVPFLSIERQGIHQKAISKLCIAGNNLIPKKILIKKE